MRYSRIVFPPPGACQDFFIGFFGHNIAESHSPLDRRDPETLGALIAFFAHKVFTQGAVRGVNPFDQLGVESGKELAAKLPPALETGETDGLDPSTAALAARVRRLMG